MILWKYVKKCARFIFSNFTSKQELIPKRKKRHCTSYTNINLTTSVNFHFRLDVWVPGSEHCVQPCSGDLLCSRVLLPEHQSETPEPQEASPDFVSAACLLNEPHKYSANKEMLVHNQLMIWKTPDLTLLSVGRIELVITQIRAGTCRK